MTLSAATVTFGLRDTALSAAAPLPVEALVLGKPVAVAAELLPRLFNLCRVAQGMAVQLTLGLPVTQDPVSEVVHDHVMKLCVILPRALGLAPRAVPSDPAQLLGPIGMPSHLDAFLRTDPLAARIDQLFPIGQAVCAPMTAPPWPLAEGAFENSAAGRQSDHPLLCAIESSHGRGPLWRYAGRLADLDAALHGRLPQAQVQDGIASVPAARGAYALHMTQAGGLVTGITRRTPTDHLLAPGGALLQSLRNLAVDRRSLAPLVIALHDPCIPVTVHEAQDA